MMSTDLLFAGVAVADYERALAWYTRLFGRPADVDVAENEAMWQVAEGGWIYVVGDASRAGSALVTLLVGNLEDQVAVLRERGLEPSAIDTMPGSHRKAALTDPEGNRITFGEALSAGK